MDETNNTQTTKTDVRERVRYLRDTEKLSFEKIRKIIKREGYISARGNAYSGSSVHALYAYGTASHNPKPATRTVIVRKKNGGELTTVTGLQSDSVLNRILHCNLPSDDKLLVLKTLSK